MINNPIRTAFFSLCCLLPLFSSAQNLNEGLLLHYPMDGSAADISGNSRDGILNGGVTPARDRFGAAMGALAFDGSGFIAFPADPALKPPAPLSLSFWVNFDQIAPGGQAILTTDFVDGQYFGVTVGLDAGNRIQVSLSNGQNESAFAGATALNSGVWHHITAVIRAADDISLYLSGCEETGSFDNTVSNIAYSDGRGNLGRANAVITTPQNNTLRGRLDDFRYWDRPLAPGEVNELYGMFFTPGISLGPDTMICTGETLTLEPRTSVDSWTWNDGSMGMTLEVSETGKFWVSATTDDCQEISDSIDVMVAYCDQCEPTVPNAFSPNNDGVNDTFRVLFDIDKCRVVDAQVMIFNRWGRKVFEAESVEERWDGRMDTQELPSDVYIYYVRYTYESDEGRIMREVKGDLTLVR